MCINKKINLIAPFSSYDYWGNLSYNVIKFLYQRGYDVKITPTRWEFDNLDGLNTEKEIKSYCNSQLLDSECKKILISPINGNDFFCHVNKSLLITTFDQSLIDNDTAHRLNTASSIIVPSEYCATVLSSCDVRTKLYINPPGIDKKYFGNTKKYKDKNKFIFFVVCDEDTQLIRKNINLILRIYNRLYGNNTDVELWIKAFSDFYQNLSNNTNIKVFRDKLTWNDILSLHKKINCYINVSMYSGWDIHSLLSMACGNQLISTRFGGCRDYFDDTLGYDVKYKYLRYTENNMLFASVDKDSLINCLTDVVSINKASSSYIINRSKKYSIRQFTDNLNKILTK